MSADIAASEETIATVNNAAGIIIGASENRVWLEIVFDGDLMHTRAVNLPAAGTCDVYVEDVPHKTTVYEHPRTMIFFSAACDLNVVRQGNRVIVSGIAVKQTDFA